LPRTLVDTLLGDARQHNAEREYEDAAMQPVIGGVEGQHRAKVDANQPNTRKDTVEQRDAEGVDAHRVVARQRANQQAE
jgi:hypothetical protein